MRDEVSLRRAKFFILGSLGLSTLLFFLLLLGRMALDRFFGAARFDIKCLLQEPLSREEISSRFFEELLDLSCDRPQNLYAFDAGWAEERILESSVIARAHVKKLSPDTLHIQYEMREPIAALADYENCYLDREGVIFAAFPYYRAKKLPLVRFGDVGPAPLGSRVNEEKREFLALLFSSIAKEKIGEVDLTHFFEKSLGRKEVVIRFSNDRLVRFWPEKMAKVLHHYELLEKHYPFEAKKPYIIDLRLAEVAYVKEGVGR